jgi:phosphatidylglycerophosphate synthase
LQRDKRISMKIKDIKACYTPEKRAAERIEPLAFVIGRPLSFPVSWLCMKAGLSATAVTYVSMFFVAAGGILLLQTNYVLQIIGVSLFVVWQIFDCADGNIARYKKSSSAYGEFVDALGGYLLNAVCFPVMGILSLQYNRFSIEELYLISAGFLCALLNLFSRLLYQKKLNLVGETGRIIKPAHQQKKSSLLNSAQAVISASGLMIPIAMIAVIIKIPELFIAIYLPVNLTMFLYTTLKLTKKTA